MSLLDEDLNDQLTEQDAFMKFVMDLGHPSDWKRQKAGKDMFGNEIKPGDYVLYLYAKSTKARWCPGIVYKHANIKTKIMDYYYMSVASKDNEHRDYWVESWKRNKSDGYYYADHIIKTDLETIMKMFGDKKKTK